MTTQTPTELGTEKKFFSKHNMIWLAIAAIVVLLLALLASFLVNRFAATKVTATFPTSVGLYNGSNVRVLGVKVGTVTKVQPEGENVRVEMRVDRGVKLPADVQATQMIPSLVADRYVQLLPAYSGGPQATGDVQIPLDRTAVPVEIDKIYANLQDLSQSLGPNGANKNGALNDVVRVAADNLEGNGAQLGDAMTQLSKAATTLSNSRGNIADTVKNLNVFVGALRSHDAQVRSFNSQMSSFNSFLAGEKEQLGQALDTLSVALGDVARFVNDNTDQIGEAIRDLQPTGQALVDNKESLLEILTVLPVAVNGLINAYDAESGTVAMRLALPQLQDLVGTPCGMLDLGSLLPGNPQAVEFSNKMRPLVDSCKEVGKQITDGILEPMLPILPFGIMSNNKLQRMEPPGSNLGNPDPKLPGGN